MSDGKFWITKGGVRKVYKWIDPPEPMVPGVRVPSFPQWLLNLTAFVQGTTSRPSVVVLDIGQTELPVSLLEEIRGLAEEEDVVFIAYLRSIGGQAHSLGLQSLFCEEVDSVALQLFKENISFTEVTEAMGGWKQTKSPA